MDVLNIVNMFVGIMCLWQLTHTKDWMMGSVLGIGATTNFCVMITNLIT